MADPGLSIDQDPEMNGLLGALITFIAKGNITKFLQGFADMTPAVLSATEVTEGVRGAMVFLKVFAKMQALAPKP